MRTLRSTHPVLLGLALLPLVASCNALDPEVRTHRAYIEQLQPLLVENSLLAERVLMMAADTYNRREVDAAAMTTTWTQDIIPLAEQINHLATFVEPPPLWEEPHGQLVEIWSDRAQAYRAVGESIALADAELWKNARSLIDDVKLREEKWFQTANRRLAAKSLAIDQFP